MHYSQCPEWESPAHNAGAPNDDCPDCALIAVAYNDGYMHGWIDSGEAHTDRLRAALGLASEDFYTDLRREAMPTGDAVEVFE